MRHLRLVVALESSCPGAACTCVRVPKGLLQAAAARSAPPDSVTMPPPHTHVPLLLLVQGRARHGGLSSSLRHSHAAQHGPGQCRAGRRHQWGRWQCRVGAPPLQQPRFLRAGHAAGRRLRPLVLVRAAVHSARCQDTAAAGCVALGCGALECHGWETRGVAEHVPSGCSNKVVGLGKLASRFKS